MLGVCSGVDYASDNITICNKENLTTNLTLSNNISVIGANATSHTIVVNSSDKIHTK